MTNDYNISKSVRLPNDSLSIGISIKTVESGEILLCEGRNFDKCACYCIEFNERNHFIALKKYKKGLLNNGTLISEANTVRFEKNYYAG